MGTGLAVVGCVSASVARSPFAVAHAGRRKIESGGDEEGAHVQRRVGHARWSVNIFADMQDATHESMDGLTHQATPGSTREPHTPGGDVPRVAFQGEPGAFSEIAIGQHWPSGATLVPCRTFAETVAAVTDGDAAFAAIPVENAIAGVVDAAVGALGLAAGRIVVLGDEVIPVHLCLMAPPGATLDALRMVHSHQMALAQCQAFLSRHAWLLPNVHDDTAGAARDVAAQGDLAQAAIAADAAAVRYGLVILARQIQDVPDNWTRFVIIGAVDAS